MDFQFLLPLLAMFTFLAALCFSIVSKKKTEDRIHSNAPKSKLAKDAEDGGFFGPTYDTFR